MWLTLSLAKKGISVKHYGEWFFKMIILKRTAAGIFYTGGILFFIYIALIIFKGNFMLNISGLIICSSGVYILIAIGSFLLISSMPDANNRFKVMRIFIIIVFTFYIMLLATMLFWSGYRRFIATIRIAEYARYNFNLIPLKTIGKYIQSFINDSMNKSIIFENILGNIFLFAPMGILLPCTFKGLHRFIKFLVTILIILVGIEIGQLFTQTGSCDIDDVILNLAGAVLFFGLFKRRITQRILYNAYILK